MVLQQAMTMEYDNGNRKLAMGLLFLLVETCYPSLPTLPVFDCLQYTNQSEIGGLGTTLIFINHEHHAC